MSVRDPNKTHSYAVGIAPDSYSNPTVLLHIEVRPCAEIISEWIKRGYHNDRNAWLEALNVKDALTQDQLDQILTGKSKPGRRLTGYLSFFLPDIMTHTDDAENAYTSRRRFINSVRRSDAQEIDLDVGTMQRLRAPLICRWFDDLEAAHTSQAMQEQETTSAQQDGDEQILHMLMEHAKRLQVAREPEEIIESVIHDYRKSPRQTIIALSALCSISDTQAETWLDTQAQDELTDLSTTLTQGHLLRKLRIFSGLYLSDSNRALSIGHGNISSWECNKYPIAATKLPDIAKLYELTEEETQRFTYARLPALNKAWLEQQPEKMRGGLYLNALRERAGFYQRAFGKMIDASKSTIGNWERGVALIEPSKIADIAKLTGASEEETQYFTYLRLPALNPDWLDKQPEKDRAGLYLRALRERSGIQQSKLNTLLELPKDCLAKWESGNTAIDVSKVDVIAELLSCSNEEKTRLSKLCSQAINHFPLKKRPRKMREHPALNEDWLNQQPEEKRAGLYLRALRERKGFGRDEFVESVDISSSLLYNWEIGNARVDPTKIRIICEKLACSEEETQRLMNLRLPALNPAWLDAQPEEKRILLYLRALRERSGLSLSELGVLSSVPNSTLGGWEAEKWAMDPSRIELLAGPLKCSDQEKERLTYLCLPTLNNKWLDSQPEKDRAGLYLRALRERSGCSQKRLGMVLGVHQTAVGHWERGKGSITLNGETIQNALNVASQDNMLKVSDEEALRLNALIDLYHEYWRNLKPQSAQLGSLDSIKNHPDLARENGKRRS